MDRKTLARLEDLDTDPAGVVGDCAVCGSDRIEVLGRDRSACLSCGEQFGDPDADGVEGRAYAPTWSR